MKMNVQALPLTASGMASELRHIGIEPGDTVIVHSSVKALNRYIVGGTAGIILALEQAVGEDGTIVMPAQSADLSDPTKWSNPPVPEAWWDTIKNEMPPFQKDLTPTFGMGAIPEGFRKQDGTLRSDHPHVSFCARGPQAAWLMEGHSLSYGLGESSPLAKLYESGAKVLLIGVGYDKNTSLHLAEYRANYSSKSVIQQQGPIMVNGNRQWVTFDDFAITSEDFDALGEAFEQSRGASVKLGTLGDATVRLMPVRDLVDYAVQWMEQNRQS